MTESEVKASWVRDLQGPDFQTERVWSKKNQKWEDRECVWQAMRREEEENKGVSRVQEGNGSDHAYGLACKRLNAQKFANLDADDDEFMRQWVVGFGHDDISLLRGNSGDNAAAVLDRSRNKRKPKSGAMVDITLVRPWSPSKGSVAGFAG